MVEILLLFHFSTSAFLYVFYFYVLAPSFSCEMLPGFSRDVVSALHAVNNLWAQEHRGPHIYHLTCVSGRLLDKDHNMTLFLFCAGSVNRRKAPAAEHALSGVLIADLAPKTSQACQEPGWKKILLLSLTLKSWHLFSLWKHTNLFLLVRSQISTSWCSNCVICIKVCIPDIPAGVSSV